MKTKDQQYLEEAYQQITRQGAGYGTELRPNYSFSQIDKEAWRGDSRFQGFDLKFPDKNTWEGILKFDNKTIDLKGQGQDVYVDGNKLDFKDRIDLRRYIISNYAASADTSNKFIGPRAFTGKGEPVRG